MARFRVNQVEFAGNATKDADFRDLNGENKVTSFNLAVNEPYKVGTEWKEHNLFIKAEAWGFLAERLRHVKKGDNVWVRGKLRLDKWEDKEGNDREMMKVAVQEAYIVPIGASDEAETQEEPAERQKPAKRRLSPKKREASSELNDDDDDPFSSELA